MTTAPHLTIDLTALADNWKSLAHKAPSSETGAVVKANAYGLGIEVAVPVFYEAGCRTFFTAMAEEAVRVRKLFKDVRVFVLNGLFEDTVSTIKENNLIPVLSSIEQVTFWAKLASGKPSALHVDTGMNRLGLVTSDAGELAENSQLRSEAGIRTLISHFACADDPEDSLNHQQMEAYKSIADAFSDLEKSLANSAAILSNTASHYDLTRPGIALYGGEAINDLPNPMKPVVSARTRILQIRQVKPGETIGYGATHKFTSNSDVAICSAGYADGFHRSSSGSGVPLRKGAPIGGYGWMDGYKVPIVGRVSMDLTAFDISQVPKSVQQKCKWIELFGQNIALDDAARSCGTIGYELLTGLGQRYIRETITT